MGTYVGHWCRAFRIGLCCLALFGILQGVALSEDGDRKAKNRVAPAYPELAKKMAITGTVKVEAVIDSTGAVKSAKAVGGHPLLIPAAVDAAKKWRFEPSSGETTQVLEFRFSPAS